MTCRAGWISRALMLTVVLGLVCAAICADAAAAPPAPKPPAAAKTPKPPVIGYTDTPFLPGGKWRVHDLNRPHPRAVAPPTASTPDKPGAPPSDAVVLFDGKDLSKWYAAGKGKDAGKQLEPKWKVENGYMEIVPKTPGISSKEKFGDCQIHVEWATPAVPTGSSQGCGNSGILIMGRYEVQVLDSYKNVTYADGQAASMYGQNPPLVNACRKSGAWQSYDIIFEAPKFEGEKLATPAYVTVLHNGLLVHHRQAYLGRSAHKRVATYTPHAPEESLSLQSHGNPIRYRNIWVRRLTGYDELAGPAEPARK